MRTADPDFEGSYYLMAGVSKQPRKELAVSAIVQVDA
jgi:hypothetical protein